MIIHKLEDKELIKFASKVVGTDLRHYLADMQIVNSENFIKLQVYLGGESDDGRSFRFKDDCCIYTNHQHRDGSKDISHAWVEFVLDCEELTPDDKNEIIRRYNARIDRKIEAYRDKMNVEKVNRDEYSC